MTEPLYEGPAGSCVINGRDTAWMNCTCCGFAICIRLVTNDAKKPTSCSMRRLTGDTSGGTTLAQNAAVTFAEYGIKVEVRAGSNVAPVAYAAARLHDGHPMVLQGNAGVLVGTPYRSTRGKVNHSITLEKGRGWSLINGFWRPTSALVYDPAADGRTASWGKAAQSPAWWPWDLVLKFAAALQPWGDQDSRTLGPGRWYVGIFPQIPALAAPHYKATVIHPTALWNDSTKRWVYNGANAVQPPTRLEVRGAAYIKGGKSCYQITSGAWATRYAGYYVPRANVKLGGLA